MGMLVAGRSPATTVNSSYGQNTLVQSVMSMLYVEQGALIYKFIFNDTIIIIPSGILPTTVITTVAPTTPSTAATLEIAVVVTGASAFVVGALTGVLLYHCISKHQSQLKHELSSHEQQQTYPEYEMPTTSGKEIELRGNRAYDPVQSIEVRGNVAYRPVQS